MKTITMLFLLLTSSAYADLPKFSHLDYVKVKKTSCDADCKFYKLDAKDPRCFIQSYRRVGPNNDIYIYALNCEMVTKLLEYQEGEIERVK